MKDQQSRLEALCRELKLPAVARNAPDLGREARRKGWGLRGFFQSAS